MVYTSRHRYRLRGLISAAYAMRTVRVLDKDLGKGKCYIFLHFNGTSFFYFMRWEYNVSLNNYLICRVLL